MRKKYIKSDNFFAKEYNDGIIVAFKNIGDNNSSYADQIHQMVSKNFGVDLFMDDIIESINEDNSHKDSIKDSIFVYVKKGVSKSAAGINLLFPNKNSIVVKYNSEKVLTIIERKEKVKYLWIVLSLTIIIAVIVCNYAPQVVSDVWSKIINMVENNELKKDTSSFNTADKDSLPVKGENVVVKTSSTIEEDRDNLSENEDSPKYIMKEKPLQEITPKDNHQKKIKTKTEKYAEVADKNYWEYAESCSHVDSSLIDSIGVNAISNYEKALELADKHIRVADKNYWEYAESFVDSIGANAISNYEKALELADEHNLFTNGKKDSLRERIQILKKELNPKKK